NFSSIEIKIIENPFKILLSLKDILSKASPQKSKIAGLDFVILPLFSLKGGKNVPLKSGLNQWNAGGRKRKIDEVYISVPIEIHKLYPKFFPPRQQEFALKTPLGEILSAKICQNNKTNPYGKALMSNPNSALAKWLLRGILRLKEGELATLERLENLGFDSVIIEKISQNEFSIDIMPLNSYEKFITDNAE
ncbi:restriction endonuclease, partial [Campylobacter troglodytis]